jgi:hypothetical protein
VNGDNEAGGFILVPLPLLATGWTMKEVMNHAFAYSAERLVISLVDHEDIAKGQESSELYARALQKIGVKFSRIPTEELPSHIQEWHETVSKVLNNYAEANDPKWAKIYGAIPTKIALALSKEEWPENRGRVLIAMASIIGKKNYSRAGWKTVSHRAAGHGWEPRRFRLPLGNKYSPEPKLMSRSQVDYQLKVLIKHNLVESFTYNRGKRNWCFPGRCTREEMARSVILKQRANQREPDSELAARIEAQLSQ